jgi:hypothetical protein
MTATADWLQDRTDERVIDALTRQCGICHAKPGVDCRHPWETTDTLDRIVHLARTTP